MSTSNLAPMSFTEQASRARPRLYWWREILYILAFYGIYTFIRNQFGSAAVSPARAYHNATKVIRIERLFGLFKEQALQHFFLSWTWFIKFWDVYYGTFHFVVSIGVLIWAFYRIPHRYALWRNTLAFCTALALIGFATFPLMPPRLLPANYHFVD